MHAYQVSMQTMGTVYIAHPIEPAHLFQRGGGDGMKRLWIFQETAFGELNETSLRSANNIETVQEIRALNDPSLQVSPKLARASIEALVRCDATRDSDRFHATLHSAAVRLGMTLLPVGIGSTRGQDENSEAFLNTACDDTGRFVRCCRVLRRLLEIGGPYVYESSHALPPGLKTLGMGFVDNGEWYELGHFLKVRAVSTFRTLKIEVAPKGEESSSQFGGKDLLKKLNGFDRSGLVGKPLTKAPKYADES